MRAKLSVSAAVVMGVLAAGCAGGYTVIDHKTDHGVYSESYLRDAASGDGVYLDLRNSPHGAARTADMAETIGRALRSSHRSVHDVAFHTNAAQKAGMRAVVLFNPGRGARPEQLCTKPDQPGAAPTDAGMSVAVALCRGERPMRWVVARRVGANASEPAGVRQLFQGVGYELFSPPDDDLGNSPDGGDMM